MSGTSGGNDEIYFEFRILGIAPERISHALRIQPNHQSGNATSPCWIYRLKAEGYGQYAARLAEMRDLIQAWTHGLNGLNVRKQLWIAVYRKASANPGAWLDLDTVATLAAAGVEVHFDGYGVPD
jgi:hypothetical protein